MAAALLAAASLGRAQSAEEQIRASRARSNAAIAAHDTAGIGAVMAPHVVVVSSASVVQVGRATNLNAFAEQFRTRAAVRYRRTPEVVEVFAPWGMASEAGRWEGGWRDADGAVAVGGRYFAKWRRIGGVWLIESETYVPDRCEGGGYCQAMVRAAEGK